MQMEPLGGNWLLLQLLAQMRVLQQLANWYAFFFDAPLVSFYKALANFHILVYQEKLIVYLICISCITINKLPLVYKCTIQY